MERLTKKYGDEYFTVVGNSSLYPIKSRKKNGISAVASKLFKYEEMEEQGLLLQLPCKEGTTAYEIADDCEYGGDCHTKRMCNDCDYRNLHVEPFIFGTQAEIVLKMPFFGKTIFLDEEKANERLQEMIKNGE